jgi:nitric oxide reductase subunit C
MFRKSWVLLFVAVMLLAACGGQAAPAASGGDAATGQKIFQQATLGKDKVPGCATCHSVEPNKKLVGPSLAGIATDAANTVKETGYKGQAKTAQDWLRESITNPNADVAEEFQPNVMPQNLKDELSSQEINSLIAYLMTLK